jgi:hypothetical protein
MHNDAYAHDVQMINACLTLVYYNGLILARLKPKLYEELENYRSMWIEELPKVVWGLRTLVSRATGYSPFFLVYGSKAVLPVDLI